MSEEKYDFIQILKEREINSRIWEKNEDFLKRNPPFLRIRKIVNINSKSEFIPESSSLGSVHFNCYKGIKNLEEKEILKSLEFLDLKIIHLSFYNFLFKESYNLLEDLEYKNFVKNFFINSCIEIGHFPKKNLLEINSMEIYIENTKNFNPESLIKILSKSEFLPNKWGISNFNEFPSMFKKIYGNFIGDNPKDKEILKLGDLSIQMFLDEIDRKFKGYQKQIIY